MQKKATTLFYLILFFTFFLIAYLFSQTPEIKSEKDVDKLYREGINFYNNSQFEKAIENLNQVVAFKADYKKADYYLRKAEKKLAQQYFDESEKLSKGEKTDEAIILLEKAGQYDEDLKEKCNKKISSILYDKALDMYEKGNLEEAVRNLEKSLDYDITKNFIIKRKISDMYHETGINLYLKKKYEDAIKNFEKALKYEEDKGIRKKIQFYNDKSKTDIIEQYYKKGLEDLKKGELFDAQKNFNKAKSFNKYHPGLDSAFLELKSKMTAKSKEYYTEGLKEYGSGNKNGALELWEKALQYDPDNIKAQTSLERTKIELGLKKE